MCLKPWKNKVLVGAIFCLLLSGMACHRDIPLAPTMPMLEIKFKLERDGESISNNHPIAMGDYIQGKVSEFRFYLSDLAFQDLNGAWIHALEVAYVDLLDTERRTLKLPLKAGQYQSIRFNIGLSPTQNGTDDPNFNPAQYPLGHPLSIYNNMYWSWNTGYIFLRIEGKADTSTTQQGNFNFNWLYHCGTDLLRQEKWIAKNFSVAQTQTNLIEIAIATDSLFGSVQQPIHVLSQPTTHTTDYFETAEKMMQNFISSLH